MESGPLSSDEFRALAADLVLFCHLTTWVEGDRHQKLLEEKGGKGHPAVMFLDAEGEVLHVLEEGTVSAMVRAQQALDTWDELTPKKERSLEEELRLFVATLDLGRLSFEEAEVKRLLLPPFPEELAAQLEARLALLEIESRLASWSSARSIDEMREINAEMSVRFVQMVRKGQVPELEGRIAEEFWDRVATQARTEEDAEVFARAIAELRGIFGDDDAFLEMFQIMEGHLAEIRAKQSSKKD